MTDLLFRLKNNPDCLISAGHTYLASSSLERLGLEHSDLVSIRRIEELHRIYRSDRVIELGAMVSLQKLISMETSILPQGIRFAIQRTVPFPARAQATIGGNLCIRSRILNLLPVFSAWEAKLELRKQGSSRIINCRDFLLPQGELDLAPSELVSRIRIPLGRWTHQYFERIEGEIRNHTSFMLPPRLPTLSFCALARITSESIEELKLSFALSNHDMVHFPNLDVQLVGLKSQLNPKDITNYIHSLQTTFSNEMYDSFHPLLERIKGLSRYFLENLHLFRDQEAIMGNRNRDG